ncbi:hypothetical protein JB92DRAFT_2910323 [Gautieria morchelliformis]|nr:hypothetical protein JB92DRAFT_2910323 [Gautieria morchelliformis]
MSDDFCGVLCGSICSFITVGCFEVCAACAIDFSTYRHTCVERQGSRRLWCFRSNQDTGETETGNAEQLPHERQPLLSDSQPKAQPMMAASSTAAVD